MAKVVYGVCGEGLGHATRVMTIVRQLLHQHEFRIFAARDAFHYLSKHLPKHENVQLHEIPGLHFQYTGNRISYARSLTCSIGYAWKMNHRVNHMREALGDFKCDLAITDFEPLTARLARKQNVPLVSIDHQHFINCLDYTKLPVWLQFKPRILSAFVSMHYHWQQQTIVSSFFGRCLKSSPKVQHVGVAIRDDILKQTPSDEQFLLVYLRRFRPRKILELLQRTKQKAIVYGHQKATSDGHLIFKPINNLTFCEDLANCRALISTAGNQLVGEALSLRKPVLAIPEPGNVEQELNGHFVNAIQAGKSISLGRFNRRRFQHFMHSLDFFREKIQPEEVVGNHSLLENIRPYLASSATPRTTNSQTTSCQTSNRQTANNQTMPIPRQS